MKLRFERSKNIKPRFHVWIGRSTYCAWCELRLLNNIYTLRMIYD